ALTTLEIMTDPDGSSRPPLSRTDLRRLRDSLGRGDDPLTDALIQQTAAQPQSTPAPAAQPARPAADLPQGTILTVCTGNICRSPMGEVLLHAQLRDLGVRVHSGGTHALVDHEMTEQAQQLAVVNGADAAEAAAH